MEFSILGALVGGLVATLVMSLLMKMATSMGMTRMPPFPLMTGSMVSGDENVAKKIGLAVHYVMMGTVVFGLVYAGIFTALGTASVLTGLVVAVVHGLIVGAMAMPTMPAMHPRMGKLPVHAGAESVSREGGQLQLSAPGFFGVNWGPMTPAGVITGHVVYGVVFALVYQAFV